MARAAGAAVPKRFVRRQLALYGALARNTPASMHRDLERGDSSELDGQLGAPTEVWTRATTCGRRQNRSG